jgi:hypothetical protein
MLSERSIAHWLTVKITTPIHLKFQYICAILLIGSQGDVWFRQGPRLVYCVPRLPKAS